jgi:hypothetical protein
VQNVQVSAWVALLVTLGVALIGAAGSVGAQLVNAWRERKREELKWHREQSIATASLKRANLTEWHDRRIETYSRMLATLNGIVDNLRKIEKVDILGGVEKIHTTHNDLHATLQTIQQEVALICSAQLLEYLTVGHLRLAIGYAGASLLGMKMALRVPEAEISEGERAEHHVRYFEMIARWMHEIDILKDGLLNEMRAELGVAIPEAS